MANDRGPGAPGLERAEAIRRDFAQAWGRVGAAWGVAPSTAAVQGYLLLHGGPLTSAEIQGALGLSHRATRTAIADCELWGIIDRAPQPRRGGSRGPAGAAWMPVGDHWEWFRRVSASRLERETDPVLPLLDGYLADARTAPQDEPGIPELLGRLEGLVEFTHRFDRAVEVVVRLRSEDIGHLFDVLDRIPDAQLDALLTTLARMPADDLVRTAAVLSEMTPDGPASAPRICQPTGCVQAGRFHVRPRWQPQGLIDRAVRHLRPEVRHCRTTRRHATILVSGRVGPPTAKGRTNGHLIDRNRHRHGHRGRHRDPRPELRWPGRITVAGLIVLGIGAIAGGIALVASPDGGVMHLDTALLAGSPFRDYLIPGLLLGGLFGLGSLVVAAMGVRRSRLAPFLAFAIGCGQMMWISVELAVIREFSLLHPTFFTLGLVIAMASVPWGWPTFRAWRMNRLARH